MTHNEDFKKDIQGWVDNVIIKRKPAILDVNSRIDYLKWFESSVNSIKNIIDYSIQNKYKEVETPENQLKSDGLDILDSFMMQCTEELMASKENK